MKKIVVIALSLIPVLFILTSCGNQNYNVPSTEVMQQESKFKEFQWSDSAYDPNVAKTTVEEKPAEAEPVGTTFGEDRWKTETYGGIAFTMIRRGKRN